MSGGPNSPLGLFDTARPKIGDRAAYMDSRGRPLAAIPHLTVELIDEHSLWLGAWLKCSDSEYRHYTAQVGSQDLPGLMALFRECPEAFLASVFLYAGPVAKPQVRVLTLEDLE